MQIPGQIWVQINSQGLLSARRCGVAVVAVGAWRFADTGGAALCYTAAIDLHSDGGADYAGKHD